jgi:hypothetical protein
VARDRYEITNLKSGKVLDLDRNDQTSVISSRGIGTQAWESHSAGSGLRSLQNAVNGNALEATRTAHNTPVRARSHDRIWSAFAARNEGGEA